MLNLNGCPKCSGATHLERDIYGSYIFCVNCGYQQNLDRRGKKFVGEPKPDWFKAQVHEAKYG